MHDEPVYGTGCSDSETDSDGDGVMNNADLCPETPSNQMNADGCSHQLDSDTVSVMHRRSFRMVSSRFRVAAQRALLLAHLLFLWAVQQILELATLCDAT